MVEPPLPDAIEAEITRLLDEPPAAYWSGIERLCAAHPERAMLIRATARGARELADQVPHPAVERGLDGDGGGTGAADFAPGDRVGPFVVRERIGEGGMGVVYLAEQKEPVKRRVALKVIKLGMDTRAVLARFEAERQALALMDHPCIAKVLEAGVTPAGRPYFAMEFVKGVPITRYCDDHRLSLDERLALFRMVCSGVQHAHTKGVVHRDLTPNNVLVALQDGVPVPKIIDFGLARATDHRLTEKTLYTERGLILGTPEYMSPEQAGLQSLDVDMRSDIYTLGVLLYELLTGCLPFDSLELRNAGYDHMCRTIRETDPPRPSTKITLQVQAPLTAARLRRTDARTLLRRLRGDLDWIVLRCLEKDRTRRYQTATHLADDVQRHLDSEPVLARAPSVGYRLAKFASRHRGQLVAGAAMLLVLLGLLALMTKFWLDEQAQTAFAGEKAAEAERQRNIAVAQAQEADHQRAEVERQKQALEQRSYVAAIHAAAWSIEHGELLDARAALASCPEALRGFEWRHLRLSSDLKLKGVIAGPAPVTAFAARADGELLAVAGGDRVVRVFDGVTGGAVVAWGPLDAPITALGFCGPDRIAIACEDGVLAVTGLEDPAPTRIGRVDATIHALVARGDTLWTGSSDGGVRRWERGAVTSVLQCTASVRALAFHVATRQLAVSGGIESIRLPDPDRGTESSGLLAGHKDTVLALAFSPDGSRLLSGGLDRRALLWDPAASKCVLELVGHELPVTAVAFAADGRRCATGSADHTVRLWDAIQGRQLGVMLGHDGKIVGIAMPRRSGQLVSLDEGGNLFWWDPTILGPSVELAGHSRWVRTLAMSADGARIVSGSEHNQEPRGQVIVWSATGERLRTLYDGDVSVHAVVHGGSWIAAGMHDGTVAFFDARGTGDRSVVQLAASPVTELALGPEALQLAAAHGDTITVLDAIQRQTVGHWHARGTIRAMASSAGGERLAWSVADTVWVRDWAGGDARELRLHVDTVLAIAFDPAGRHLAVAGSAAIAVVHDLVDGTSVTCRGHRNEIDAVTFDPTGRRLLTAGRDCMLRIWDAASGDCLLVLRGHPYAVAAAMFSPDGTRIVSGSDDKTVRIWESRLEPLQRLWAQRGR